MNKKFTFWLIVVAVIIGLVLFFKFNPLYATFEVVTAFGLGLFAEWIGERVYNKWIK